MDLKRRVRPCTLLLDAVAVVQPTEPPVITLDSPAVDSFTEIPPVTQTQVVTAGAVACMVVTTGGAQPRSNMGFMASGRAFEKTNITTLARIMLPTNGPLLQGLVTGDAGGTNIKLNVYDLTNNNTQVGSEADLTCSAVVYDTYQLDSSWSVDTIGYNFKHTYTGTSLDKAGHRIRLEYFVPTDEGNLYVVSIMKMSRVLKA